MGFLSVMRRRPKPHRNTVLVGYGTAGQKQMEETISQAAHYKINNAFTAVIVANWHQESLDPRLLVMARFVRLFKPKQMLEGAQDGLLGNLDLAEETKVEWRPQLKQWLAGAVWQTTHVRGNLACVCHFLSSGGGHLLVTQVGVEESHGTIR